MNTDRQKSVIKEKIIYGICGVIVMLALLPFLTGSERKTDTQAQVLFLGDSIVGQYRDETSIPMLIAQMLDVKVANGAFGGTTMSLQNRDWRDAYYWDGLSCTQLTRAVAAQDFGLQQTIRTKDYVTMDFIDYVDELDCLDLTSVETLVISYGMNDYTTGSPICNEDDPTDPYTMQGAMRVGIDYLRRSYPQLRIIFISPTYCWFVNTQGVTDETCETNDFGGGYLEDYVEAQRQVAQESGVEFVDLYHAYYPHEEFMDWVLYTNDGIHPSEQGREKIAGTLAELLRD